MAKIHNQPKSTLVSQQTSKRDAENTTRNPSSNKLSDTNASVKISPKVLFSPAQEKVNSSIVAAKGTSAISIFMLPYTGGYTVNGDTERKLKIPILYKLSQNASITDETSEWVFYADMAEEEGLKITSGFANNSTLMGDTLLKPNGLEGYILPENSYSYIHRRPLTANELSRNKINYVNIVSFQSTKLQDASVYGRLQALSNIPIIQIGTPIGEIKNARKNRLGSGWVCEKIKVTGIICLEKDKKVLQSEMKKLNLNIKLASVKEDDFTGLYNYDENARLNLMQQLS